VDLVYVTPSFYGQPTFSVNLELNVMLGNERSHKVASNFSPT
jgi:hypothetical protein